MPTPFLPVKTTQLQPHLDNLYKAWVLQNSVPQSNDYDMRGFYLGGLLGDPSAQTTVDPSDNQIHYSDKWKLPNHPMFSGESIYSTSKTDPYWLGNETNYGKTDWNLPPYAADTWARIDPRKGLLNLFLPSGQ